MTLNKNSKLIINFIQFYKQEFINQLSEILIKKGVNIVNTLEIFNREREYSNNLLYQLDDTHWNSNKVRVIAEELRSTIN